MHDHYRYKTILLNSHTCFTTYFPSSSNGSLSSFQTHSTGVISGYVVSRQALVTRIARAEMDKAQAAEESEVKKGRDALWDMNRGEGGAGGLETLEDKYATTK